MFNWLRNLLGRKSMPLTDGRRAHRRPATPVLRLEALEDRVTPTTNISFDAVTTHALTINVGAANETATLRVIGPTLEVASSQGTTSDGSLGFSTSTGANTFNSGSIAAPNDVRQIIVTGFDGTQTVNIAGGTFPALSITDGTIGDVIFDVSNTTIAEISASAPNANLDVNAVGTITLGQNITTQSGGSIGLAATNGITLSAGVTLDTTNGGTTAAGGAITLGAIAGAGNTLSLNAGTGGLITATGAIDNVSTLTVTNSGGTTFEGDVGQGTPGAVTLSNTTGTIAFQGNTAITTLSTANAAYNVSFTGGNTSITGLTPTAYLNTGTVTLGGSSGDTLTFANGLDTTSGPSSTIVGGTVQTVGTPLTLGSVTLAANSTLDTTAGPTLAGAAIGVGAVTGAGHALALKAGTTGVITASGAIDNVSTLTVTNSAGATFQNTLGAGTPGAVTLSNTTGTIAFQGNTAITTLTTAAQGYSVSFSGTTNTVTNLATFLNTGTVSLTGAAGDTTTFSGGLTVNGATVTAAPGTVNTGDLTVTTGSFSGAGATLTSGNVSQGGGTLTAPANTWDVSGNWSKTGGTFTPGTGTVDFTGSANTLDSGGTAFNNVTYSGTGTLTLANNGLTVNGTFHNAGTFDLAGKALNVTTTFTNPGTLRLRGVESVTLPAAGNDTTEGTWLYYGNNTAGPLTIKDFGATDYYNLTINDQNGTKADYQIAAALKVAHDFTLTSGALDDATAAADSLAVNGQASFGDTVGATRALNSIIVLGTTTIATSTINTDAGTGPGGGRGQQTYSNAVTLNADTTLTTTGSSFLDGEVVFDGAVDGPHSLTISAFGFVAFSNPGVGTTTPLTSLNVSHSLFITDNATAIKTTGLQNYNDGFVIGVASSTLTSTTNGAITFGGTVDSSTNTPEALTVNTGGATTFNQAVGGTDPLASLTTDAGGTVSLKSVKTAGIQSYGDSTVTLNGTYDSTAANGAFSAAATAVLAGDTSVKTGSGTIDFGALGGNFALSTDSSGVTTFAGPVGTGPSGALKKLTTVAEAGGSTVISGSAVKTTGDQTYNNPVTITADTTYTDSGTGIFFNSSVDGDGSAGGPWALTTTTTVSGAKIQFNGTVGSTNPLMSLTVNDAGISDSAIGAIEDHGNIHTALIKQGTGTFALTNANNTYSGGTTVTDGILNISADRNLGAVPVAPALNITLNGGTLQLGASFASVNTNRGIALGASGGTIDTNGFNTAIAGAINDANVLFPGSLTKTGSGTLSLTNTNDSYSGGTNVTGGILNVNNDRELGTASSGLTLSGGTLEFSASFNLSSTRGVNLGTGGGTILITGGLSTNLGNTITGTALTVTGGGGVTLSSTANNYTGGTTINGATVSIDDDRELGNPTGGLTFSTGTLQLNASLNLAATRNIALLAGGGTISISPGNNTTVASAITGVSSFAVAGGGLVALTNIANNYTGGTAVGLATTLKLDDDRELGATSGGLSLFGGTLQLAAAMTLNANRSVVVTPSGGTIDTNGFNGIVGGAIANLIFGMPGSLTKQGTGSLTLAGTNTYTGTTTVSAGVLLVDGSTAPASAVTVNTGAALGGHGNVQGSVTLNGGAHLAPGDSPGVLNTGALSFTAGSTFDVEIGGNAPGNGTSGYDQDNVTGTVTIDTANPGVALNLSQFGGYTPQGGDEYVIINNDGADAVTGTFVAGNGIDAVTAGTPLPEGALLSSNFLGVNGLKAYLTYKGGDGNDVAILVAGPANFIAPPGGSTQLRLAISGQSLQFLNGNTVVDSRPLASVTQVNVTGAANAADTLTVDYTNGIFPIPVSFDGGTGTGNNTLVLHGGTFTKDTFNYTDAHSGNIQLNDGTDPQFQITYSNLQPVLVNSNTTTDYVFTLPNGTVNASLEDNLVAGNPTPGDGMSQLRSTNAAFEVTTFTNPTGSLTIRSGTGTDAVMVAGNFDSGTGVSQFDAGMVINLQNAGDSITINPALTATSLAVTAAAGITLNNNVTTGAGSQGYNSLVTLGASVNLTAGTVTFSSTVDDTTANTDGLTVTGNAVFDGAVGSGKALGSVHVTGTTNFAAAASSVTTSTTQSYDGAATIGLTGGALSLTGSAITFGSTVDDAGNSLDSLTTTSTGATTFTGAVGTTSAALKSLTTGAGGSTVIMGGAVKTTGDQTYNNPVTITANTTLTDSGTGIVFNSTVDGDGNGPWALTATTTVNTAQIQFNSTVGGIHPLKSVTVTDVGPGSATGAIVDDNVTHTTFTKQGAGTFTLGGTNTYTGATTVSAGTLLVDGSTVAASAFTVSGGTLGGIGTVNGTVSNSAVIDPGDTPAGNPGPGVLHSGAVTFNTGSSFIAEIAGTTPGVGAGHYDQLNVTGAVALGNGIATLSLTQLNPFTASPGDEYVLIQSTAGITGNFAGLPEGMIVTNNFMSSGEPGRITYKGGLNGDAVAIVVDGPASYTGAGQLSLRLDPTGATNLQFLVGGVVQDSRPLAGVSSVAVTGSAGADTLTIDYSNGVFLKPITFDGGGGGDTLKLTGGTLNSLTYDATGPHAGTLILNSDATDTIGFTNLAPVIVTSSLGTVNVTVSDTNPHTTTFTAGPGAGQNMVTIDGGLESMTFNDPTVALIVDGNSANDTIDFTSLDVGFNAALTVDGMGGTDTINDNTALTLGSATSTGNVALTAETINVTQSIDTTAGTTGNVSFDLGADGTQLTIGTGANITAKGSVTQTGTGAVSLGANITTTNAPVSFADAVALTGDVMVSAGAGNVTFSSTVDGPHNLTVNSSGATTFGGAVGGTTALTSVTTDAAGSTDLNGGAVTTTGAQAYNDAVVLSANTTLTSSGGGNVTLAKTVDGAFGLTVNTGGVTTFGGAVGGTTALTSVTTDAAGSTDLNGGTVTTTGAQAYNDAVLLGANTTLTSSGGGNVTLAKTVDGAFSLTVNTAGVTTFGGAVGGTTALTSVTTDAAGSTDLNGGAVTTTGAQAYNDAVLLGANTTLTSTGSGNVTLATTVDGAFGLTVNTAGVTTFGGAVGGTTALTSVTTDAPGSTDLNGGSVTTTGAQAYNDAVVLSANTTLTSTGSGNVTLASTVNGAFGLTVNTGGVTTFGGAVGGTTALTSVTTDATGSTDLNGGSVTTTGAQSYNDAVVLSANTTLTSTGSGNVTLAKTVDGAFDLTVNTGGVTTFGGAVGGTTALTSVTTDAAGSTDLNGGSVTTTGAQSYNDALLLGANTTLTSTGSGNVTLASTVNGAFSLTVNTGGVTTFDGAVGGTTALTSVTTDAAGSTDLNGGSVITTGAQSYNDAVVLSANTTLTSTGSGNVTLTSTVNGAFSLTVNTGGVTTFGGAVGGTTALTSVTTDAPGSTDLNGGAVTTTGAQSYDDAVVLSANTTLTSSGGGNVTFGSTVNGAFGLTVNTGGVTTFGGAVGGTTALTSVTTDAPGSTDLNGGSVSTTGAQSYNDAVVLSANTTLTSTGSGNVTLAKTVDGAFGLTVNTGGVTTFGGAVGGTTTLTSVTTDAAGSTDLNGGSVSTTGAQSYNDAVVLSANTTLTSTGSGNVTLAKTVDGAFGLTVNTAGVTTFGGAVGGTTALTSVTTDAAGSTDLNGGAVTTTGAQSYNDAVVLSANTTLTSTGSGNVTLAKTVDGAFSLTVNTAGVTTFDGAVGGTTALTSVTTDAAGSTDLNGGSVTTTAAQSYNDAVVLSANTTLTSTGSGNVTLAKTVDGAFGLTVNTAGVTTFDGAVGGTTALTSVTTDAAGSTDLNGGSVTTTAAQSYNDAVVLSANTTLTSTGSGNVTLASTVNGAFSLTVNTAGVTTFGGAVGGTTALTSVTTDAAGSTDLNGGAVTTTGAQSYNDAIVLSANTTLTSTGSANVTLAKTVDGAFGLTVNTGGVTTFGGAVGGTTALTSVTTDSPGSTDLNGGSISTTGAQAYNDAVVLSANTTLTSTGSGNVTLASTVNGAFSLTVNTAGVTTFDGAVGGTTALTSVTTDAAGSTDLNGAAVTTTGAQSYNDAVVLSANTTLTSSGGGNVTFGSTVNGAFGLTVNTGGVTTFGGAVGGTTALTSVTTDAAGSTDLNGGTVTTTGVQSYNDAVVLSANTTLTSTGSGNVTLASTVNGAFSLTVNTAGVTTFDGAVGGTTALTSVTTDAPGSTDLNGGAVTTTGAQSYNDAVVLSANTTLTSSGGGNVTFGSTVNGAFSLTVNTAGVTTFDGAVGGTTALTSVTTDAPGSTDLNGGAVTTTGAQSYNDAVVLSANTTLTSTGSANITLAKTVDGAFGLTVNTAGVTTFDGTVGGTTALTSVTTDAPGSTDLNGGAVTTTGAQSYNDAVLLGANTTLTSTGSGNVTLAKTVDGAFGLTVNTAGITTFDGAVGGTTALTSVTTDAAGSTDLNGGSVTTTAAQTYNDAIALSANTTLSSTGGGNVTFASTVNGAFGLTVNTGGVTIFDGAVGGTTALTSVTTDAPGSTDLNGGAVTTTGPQTYNDPVVLTADTTLTSTGGGNITFGNSVNGAHSLTTNTSGATTFEGPVGNTTPLTSVTVSGAGVTDLNGGGLTTTADQVYNGPVVLTADTTLGAHNIAFGSTLDSDAVTARSLTVNATGNLAFVGNVGVTHPLNVVTINSAVNVTNSAAFKATSLQQVAGSGTTAINGPMTVSGVAGIDITTNTITLNANVSATAANATVRLDPTAGGVTQTAGVLTAPNLLLNGAGTFLLDQTGNDITTLAAAVNGAVSYRDTNAIVVGTVLSTNGITTTNGNLTLNSGAGALTITQAVNTGSRTVRLVSGDVVTQSGGGTITTSAGLGVQAVNAINLGLSNSVGTFAAKVTTAGQSVLFNDVGGFTVGTVTVDPSAAFPQVIGISTASGNVTLTATGTLTVGDSNGQGISAGTATVDLNAAGVTENAGSAITVANLRLRGVGTFTLNQGNDAGTLAVATAGGPVSYNDVNALTVGTVLGTAGITTSGNNLTLTTGGLLTLGSGAGEAVTATGATVDIIAAGVTESANSAISAANLRLQGAGTFMLMKGNAIATLAGATAGAIAFNNGNALVVGTVLGTAGITSTNSNVTLQITAGGLTLNNALNAGTALVGVYSAGPVIQATAGPITAGSLGIVAGGAIDLCSANAANSVGTLAVNELAAGAAVLFGDSVGLTVGAVPVAPLFPGATGITTNNGNVTLEDTGSNLGFNNAVSAGAGTVALTSTGPITQATGGPIVAATLGIRAGATIDLLSANAANRVVTLAANDTTTGAGIYFNDTIALAVGELATSTCFAGASGIRSPGGTVDLIAAGMTENAGAVITATNLRLRGAGVFALTQANDVASLAAAIAGPVNYTDVNDVTIGTVFGTAGINTGGKGGVTLTATGVLTIGDGRGQGITATGATVDLNAASGTEAAGSIIAAANLRLLNGAFALQQSNQVATLAAATGGTLSYTNAGALAVGTVLGTLGINTGGGTFQVPGGSSTSSTPGVFDPATGIWYLRNDNSAGAPGFTPFPYGAPGWIPVVGDWNGDGTVSVGVVDPVTMTWYLRNTNSSGAPSYTKFQYGAPGWIPVVGDWDGNGTTTIGVVDPRSETWYLRNSNSPGAPDITPFAYGGTGWIPVAGDWDGNHTTTIGVVDPQTEVWYLKNSNGAGAPDFKPFAYGAPGWTPVVGDWDGNGTTTAGVFDPSTGTWYEKNSNTSGAPDATPFRYGAGNWTPVAGNWLPTKVLPPHTVTVAGGGSNVTLTTGGPLAIGSGAAEGIIAGGATVDLSSAAGVFEQTKSIISATNLRLQGNGGFLLGELNRITTLAGNTAGGPVGVLDGNDLTVGSVNGTNGFTTANEPLTLNTSGNLLVSQAINTGSAVKSSPALTLIAQAGVLTVNAPLTTAATALSAGTNLTINAPINTGGAPLVAYTDTTAVGSAVAVNALISAASVAINGGSGADTFTITPSPNTPITVNGGSPVVVPGDRLFLENLQNFQGLPTANVTGFKLFNQSGDSKDGVFAFDNRQPVFFTSIETLSQVNVTVSSYQTDAQGDFQIQATLNFTSTSIKGLSSANISSSGHPPFFLAANMTNPIAPFSAPQVAVGDVNGDGIQDVIIALGSTNGPQVTVIDGKAIIRLANDPNATLTQSDILTQFFAFDPTFFGGLFVASGDVQGNGRAAIVVGAGAGTVPNGGAQVRTFVNVAGPGGVQMQQLTGSPLGAFNPYGPGFTGGVHVAVGDVDGDGHADIITAPGSGMSPLVNVYSGASGAQLSSFMAYDPAFQGGVYVAAGTYEGNSSTADILVGPGAGLAPEIKVFKGNNPGGVPPLADFLAYHPQSTSQSPGSNSAPLVGVSSVAFGGRDLGSGNLNILVGVGRDGLGVNNGRSGLGFGFQGTSYGPDAATQVFIEFGNGQPILLDGIDFGGVVTGNS